jgi:hypothetical protein
MLIRPLFHFPPHSLSRSSFRAAFCRVHFLIVASFVVAVVPAAAETDSLLSDVPTRIEALRKEAEHLRDQAETGYETAEKACYRRFLVNRCINEAKSKRLEIIRRARELENEARRLDRSERARAADEVKDNAAARGIGSRPIVPSSPMPDAVLQEIETPEVDDGAPSAARASAARISANARRARTREDATRRADAARRDRERYDARIREYEEKRTRDADGR